MTRGVVWVEPPPHGTRSRHTGGKNFDPCRCVLCKEAYNVRFRNPKVTTGRAPVWDLFDCTPTRSELLEMRG